jgi:hypothetical protein
MSYSIAVRMLNFKRLHNAELWGRIPSRSCVHNSVSWDIAEKGGQIWSESLATQCKFIVLPVRYERIYLCYVEESRPPLLPSGQSFWLHNGNLLCFLWGTNWIYICYVEESRPHLWSTGQSSWLHNRDLLCFLWGTNWSYICYVEESRPPLWSSGQSSWLQIRRTGFDSRHYQKKGSGSGMGSTQTREYNWGATW